MNTLADRRALITGGGGGVGAVMATGFAAQGAEVVVTGRTAASLDAVAAQSARIHAVVADVTSEQQVGELFANNGPFDIVIANAGNSAAGPFERLMLADWHNLIDVNLTGVFLVFREALRSLDHATPEAPQIRRLIAVASTAGLKGYAYAGAYSAAKHGVVGLVRSLALEYARRPVTINALCPGFLDTDMTTRSIDNIVAGTGRSRSDALAALQKFNPQQRLVQPAEVCAAALWLCADNSAAINGVALPIAGGEV